MLRLRPYIARAPAALAFRPAGRNCSSLSGLLVHQRAGGDVAVHQLAELPLGALPLRQVVLSPGANCVHANVAWRTRAHYPGAGEASAVKLLAARSPYRIDFVACVTAKCTGEACGSDARVPRSVATSRDALSALRTLRAVPDGLTPVEMSSVGMTISQMRFAHVEWSPHIEGNAAVMSEDGSVQLFAVPSAASASARAPSLQGAPTGFRLVGCWLSACARSRFANLPR